MPANGSAIREAIVPADVRASCGTTGRKLRCDGNLGTSSPDELKQWPPDCQVCGEAAVPVGRINSPQSSAQTFGNSAAPTEHVEVNLSDHEAGQDEK